MPLPGAVGAVARLRGRGVPSRLRPRDGVVEIWREGAFTPFRAEQTGQAVFLRRAGEEPLYRRNWSLSRWAGDGWQDLLFSDGEWQGAFLPAQLTAGRYRILTALRLPSGDQFAARRTFLLAPGEEKEIALYLRGCETADLIAPRALPLVDGRPRAGRCALLFWLEEGAEPTEHLLNELTAAGTALRALPAEPVFFLRRRGAERQRTLRALLAGWPGARLEYPEDWDDQVESLARCLDCDPERPPLTVVCTRDGRAAYAASGYRVGEGDLLRRIAALLCGS